MTESQDDLDKSWREMYDAEGQARRTTHKPLPAEVGFAEFLSRKGRNRGAPQG